ncbi:hypothetical protein AAG747_14045 [Rapidithrix thailandica]|uniref:Uncharacterized protein n=1 Tax=Rapidithrix thailandica TaxID=413964 RepID=A0AAW9SDU9_9BACT
MAATALLAAGSAAKGVVEGIPPLVWKALLGAGVVFAGYLVFKKVQQREREKKFDNAYGSDTSLGRAAVYASRYYSAMWENDFFGWSEDEAEIFRTAQDMAQAGVSFGPVSQAYQMRYGKDLLKNIQNALNPTEFSKFRKLLAGDLSGLVIAEKVYAKGLVPVFSSDLQKVQYIRSPQPLGMKQAVVILGDVPFVAFENKARHYFVPLQNVTVKTA